jgi:ElaB/YqjD/DUF883 family membrane-anchored ribosome-binding protein
MVEHKRLPEFRKLKLAPPTGGDYHRRCSHRSKFVQLGVHVMTAEVNTDKLFQDLQAVVHDAEALLMATAGQAGDKVQEVRSRAEETIRKVRSNLNSMEDSALRRAKELAGQADGYVRENPWQAVGVAAGIGLLLGVMLSRRS